MPRGVIKVRDTEIHYDSGQGFAACNPNKTGLHMAKSDGDVITCNKCAARMSTQLINYLRSTQNISVALYEASVGMDVGAMTYEQCQQIREKEGRKRR